MDKLMDMQKANILLPEEILQAIENTMLIEITDQKAVKVLYELEEQNLIRVIKENFISFKQNSLTNTEIYFLGKTQ